jgi:hypothetical protein
MLVETVLGPVWVWLAGYEQPTFAGFVGGGVLLAAMVCNSVLAIREAGDKAGCAGKHGGVAKAVGGDVGDL